jgi:RNA polymerase sigma-70 factor (ECF subfamily)
MTDPSTEDDEPRTEWLARYQPWLRLLARTEIDSRFGGKFSASDAVQQTMLEAWKGWNECRGEAEAQRMAWLRQILAHQLAHLARRYAGTQKRDVSREVSIEHSLAQSSMRLEHILAGESATPSKHAMINEQQLQLAEMLQRLPEDYRTVIILRNLEDLPFADIARRMNRKPGAVRMLWVRALARLRDEVESDTSSGGGNAGLPH